MECENLIDMENKSEYLPVNWMQGMNVSSSHFVATENYLLERMLRNTSVLQSPFLYGLLPEEKGEPSMRLRINGKGSHALLVLDAYRGMTPGGYMLLLNDGNERVSCPCETEGEVPEAGWDVVLSVSPYDRNPSGEPNLQETPPRYPFVEPSYRLNMVARLKKEVNRYGPFDVVVGLLRKKESAFVLDANYIPSSMTMSSHPDLRGYVNSLSEKIATIQNSVRLVIEKAMGQSDRSSVMDSVLLLSKELMRSLGSLYFRWRNCAYTLSPYQAVEILTSLANSVMVGLGFLPKREKEEMLKYFYEWNGISPSSFEHMMEEAVDKPYNHNRIRSSMLVVDGVIRTLEELFVNLSHLDYIGQHKESIVISVSERHSDGASSKGTGWLVVD